MTFRVGEIQRLGRHCSCCAYLAVRELRKELIDNERRFARFGSRCRCPRCTSAKGCCHGRMLLQRGMRNERLWRPVMRERRRKRRKQHKCGGRTGRWSRENRPDALRLHSRNGALAVPWIRDSGGSRWCRSGSPAQPCCAAIISRKPGKPATSATRPPSAAFAVPSYWTMTVN